MKRAVFGIVITSIVLLIAFVVFFAMNYEGFALKTTEYEEDEQQVELLGEQHDTTGIGNNVPNYKNDSESQNIQVITDDFKEISINVGKMGKSFAVSGDAKKIAYTGFNVVNGTAEIWVCDIDEELNTSNQKLIDSCTVNYGNTGFWNIVWLPDNSGIIYFSDENYKIEIKRYTIKDEQKTLLRLVEADMGISSISFGNITKKMYYAEDVVTDYVKSTFKTSNVWFDNVSAIGTVVTPISDRIHVIPMVQISPNEEDIVFSGYNRFTNKYCVWIYNIQTEELKEVSDGNSHAVTPMWSPNGKYIAYSQKDDNSRYYIVVYNAENDDKINISLDETDMVHPCWHPDGKSIFYIYEKGNIMGIHCRVLPGL